MGLRLFCVAWAVAAAASALAALPDVNADAVPYVALASIALPACAAAAPLAMQGGRTHLAGWLLVASAMTPTYFAWVLGVPALVIGIALVIHPIALRTASS